MVHIVAGTSAGDARIDGAPRGIDWNCVALTAASNDCPLCDRLFDTHWDMIQHARDKHIEDLIVIATACMMAGPTRECVPEPPPLPVERRPHRQGRGGIEDPLEAKVAMLLDDLGEDYDRDHPARLDFHLPRLDLFIECKRFATPRIAEQLERVTGRDAVVLMGIGSLEKLRAIIGVGDAKLSSTLAEPGGGAV